MFYEINKERILEQCREYDKNHKEEKKQYTKINRKIITKKHTDYERVNFLRSTKLNNGKYVHCNKRSYPLDNACELCGRKNTRLVYHHWNNEKLEFGIWTCNSVKCHWLMEVLELPIVDFEQCKKHYLELREKIEKGEISYKTLT